MFMMKTILKVTMVMAMTMAMAMLTTKVPMDFRMNMSKPSWLEYKGELGFDFPNLPYYQVICHLWVKKKQVIYLLKHHHQKQQQ